MLDFVIHGRITRENGKGIHGLRVKAYDRDHKFDQHFRVVRTRADGGYQIVCPPAGNDALFAAKPEILVEAATADGKVVFKAERGRACKPGGRAAFNAKISSKELTAHEAKVRAIAPSRTVLSQVATDTIAGAWRQLAISAGDPRAFQSHWLLCPAPPMARIDDLLDDAIDVIAGFPDALQRFRDKLTIMEAAMPMSDGRRQHLAKFSDAQLEDPDFWAGLQKEVRSVRARLPTSHSSALGQDVALTLFMAAMVAGGTDTRAIHGNLSIIHGQICPMRRLDPLVHTARDVLVGRPGALDTFRQTWRAWTWECGPDDGPIPPFPDPKPQPDPFPIPDPCPDPWPPLPDELPRVPSILEELECFMDLALLYRRQRGLTYTITDISPPNACPGDTITITGTDFGPAQGSVIFRAADGGTASGTVQSWSDTSIVVVVPEGAGCGLLSLQIYGDTIEVCGRLIDLYKQNTGETIFLGGETHVSALAFLGTATTGCAAPGGTVQVYWRTCNATSITVRVEDATGTTLLTVDPAAGEDTRTVALPAYSVSTEVTVTVTITGPCGSDSASETILIQAPYQLSIDGMEVTQAIQYYQAAQHLTDVNDRGPDNSLQLVANKAAMVRVYLRSGQDAGFENGDLQNVDGTLQLDRRVNGVWGFVGLFASDNGPVTARDAFGSYDAERNSLNNTLNFIIPAGRMNGLLRMTVRVNSPDACVGGEAEDSLQVDVNLQQTLQVAAVAIGYNGPGAPAGQPNIPTNNQITADVGFALTIYPVSSAPNIRTVATPVTNQPLNNNNFPAGGCDPNWITLINLVVNARTNDGNQPGWIYYGFVTPTIQITHGNVGCATGINAAGIIGNGGTFAHEAGHQMGLPHAPCGAVGTPNANYPLYEPYDTGVTVVNAAGNTVWSDASIGEYGVDITNRRVLNPNPGRLNTGKDLMAYCGTSWVSVFTHNFVVNNAQLNPQALATGFGDGGIMEAEGAMAGQGASDPRVAGDDLRSRITVLGRVSADGAVDVTGLNRATARMPTVNGARTAYRAELVDEKGQVACTAPVFTLPLHQGDGCGCGGGPGDGPGGGEPAEPPFAFIAVLDDACEGSALCIRRDDEVVWERKRPARRTKLGKVTARPVRGGRLRISWDFEQPPEGEWEVWLRWSGDGGKTWNGLAIDLHDDSVEVDAGSLPEKVIIEALCHDGFATARARSRPVRTSRPRPSLSILHPADRGTVEAGKPLRLWGTLVSGEARDEAVVWKLDGKEIGRGRDVWVPPVKRGRHELVMQTRGAEPVKVQFTAR